VLVQPDVTEMLPITFRLEVCIKEIGMKSLRVELDFQNKERHEKIVFDEYSRKVTR